MCAQWPLLWFSGGMWGGLLQSAVWAAPGQIDATGHLGEGASPQGTTDLTLVLTCDT